MKSKSTRDFSLFQLNCQSVKGKATQGIITDLFVEHDMDIFALTETWFLMMNQMSFTYPC